MAAESLATCGAELLAAATARGFLTGALGAATDVTYARSKLTGALAAAVIGPSEKAAARIWSAAGEPCVAPAPGAGRIAQVAIPASAAASPLTAANRRAAEGRRRRLRREAGGAEGVSARRRPGAADVVFKRVLRGCVAVRWLCWPT